MAKQTLYEILGVAENAAAEDIQPAYEARRQALCEQFAGEDRRNHLSFLDHARDVLADRRRRAVYDRQSRLRPADPEPPRAGPLTGGKLLGGLLLLAAAALLGRQFLPRTPGAAPSPSVVAVASSSASARLGEASP